jgi:hypothetical protein
MITVLPFSVASKLSPEVNGTAGPVLCEKHKGMSFTMTIGTHTVPVRTICPHCEPIRPEEPTEPYHGIGCAARRGGSCNCAAEVKPENGDDKQ